jgi:hypothetical protein
VAIQLIHVQSRDENALPLIMSPGWLGSFIELLGTVDPLTDLMGRHAVEGWVGYHPNRCVGGAWHLHDGDACRVPFTTLICVSVGAATSAASRAVPHILARDLAMSTAGDDASEGVETPPTRVRRKT